MFRGKTWFSLWSVALVLAAAASAAGRAPGNGGTPAAGNGATGAAAAAGSGATAAAGKGSAHGPVVVELFTSQGCSSCPPADRLLSRLKREQRLTGAVIPLAFHVDYWNHQGWTDPFSSPRWSQRQEGYAHAFHSNRIYTPQLVVNGRSECVGSEEREVMRRIGEALSAAPAGQVSLSAPAEPLPGTDASARVTVTARLLRPVAGAGLDLWVALTESGLTTAVGAGENASATLHDDHVVRQLVKAFTLPPTAGAERSVEVTLGLDRSWKGPGVDVVAFLQDPQSLTIEGAASRPLIAR